MQAFNLSNIFNRAWSLVKTYGISMSEALRKAWAIAKLRKQMAKGIVKFAYYKVDGSIRTAWGTLKESILPATSGRKSSDKVVTYYDTEKREYRCFKPINIIL